MLRNFYGCKCLHIRFQKNNLTFCFKSLNKEEQTTFPGQTDGKTEIIGLNWKFIETENSGEIHKTKS